MEFVTFDDQITSFCPFSTTRSLSSDIVRTPLESLRGSSLLANHTTVNAEMLLYHIPTYRLVEFFGLKNPSLKALPLLEIIKSGSLMGLEAVMVFVADPNSKQMQHSKTRRTDMLVF